ncbi:MAG: hypothetical protein EP330_22940 [Deltaproteobacteria bacterium]|nr:MAG: hypothetical protein EP330_22940 [Deltaproteobacteria bacterium]
MPNPYIPRSDVHTWSDDIGQNIEAHNAALTRLLKDQRRLTRWLEENAANMSPATASVGAYLFGVIARIIDLAGGRLRSATWEQVRAAEQRVSQAVAELLPIEGFEDRLREVEWRAQPHILDEAWMALFERKPDEEVEVDLDPNESLKLFLCMWVATEVLDANWRPRKGYEGETSYTHVAIDPSA